MHKYLLSFFILAILFVGISGCVKSTPSLEKDPITTPKVTQTLFPFQNQKHLEWFPIQSGVEIKHIPYPYNNAEYYLQVVKIDPQQHRLRLEYDQEGKTIRSWLKDTDGIVMNAGFFKEENASVGLLYIDGNRIDDHRIRPEGTGIIDLDREQLVIRDLSKEPLQSGETFTNALQSYPLLVSGGQLVISDSSMSQDRRSAIGTDANNSIYLITAEYPHLSLSEFAQQILNADLEIQQLLNLDGGGSTGIGIRVGEYERFIDSQTVIPTVLMLE